MYLATNSDVMLKTEVPLLPNTSCARAYTMLNLTDLYEGQLCAGGEEGIDSCRGDSGGPLMAKCGKCWTKFFKLNILWTGYIIIFITIFI